jgi:hypothetical protein
MSNRIRQLGDEVQSELEEIILDISRRDDLSDKEWKKSTEAIFLTHGFHVTTRFIVPSRGGKYYRGKVGLVCTRGDFTIAMEFGHKSVRRKSIPKLNQVSSSAIRLVGLRLGNQNGEIPGIDRVFSRLHTK